jgi:N-methylhydantoinase B
VVDPTILPNSGLARPITVTAPLGTVMNATHPAAVNANHQIGGALTGAGARAVCPVPNL